MQNWGTVAEQYSYGSFNATDGTPPCGVQCLVRSGVVFVGPPPESAGLRSWEAVPTDMLRYVMPLGDDPMPPQHESLHAVAERLQSRAAAAALGRGDLPEGDADLGLFNWAVLRLFELAALLQDDEAWLGRIHPDNVQIVEPDGFGTRELVLTDWGYANNPALNLGPKPDWVTNSAWALLWDFTPAVMNETVLSGKRPDEKGVDRRTLTRLLLCLLVGRAQAEEWCKRASPSKRGGSRLYDLPRGDAGMKTPLWVKLRESLEDKIGLGDLISFLKANPPGDHFLAVVAAGREQMESAKAAGRQRARRRLLAAGVAVPLMVVGAAGGYVGLKAAGMFDKPISPHELCQMCPGSSPLYPGLDALKAARAEGRDAEVTALADLHTLAEKEGRTPIPAELECLATQRKETLRNLERDYALLKIRLNGIADDPEAEIKALDALLARVNPVLRLAPRETPPSWLSDLKEKRRWLGP